MKRAGVPLEAIEAVYRARAADFFRFALAKTGDPERAHDAVQEGFARAIRSRSTFRGTGPLEAWIARCVINAAHDFNRLGAAIGVEPQDAEVVTGGPDEAGWAVRDAVRQLPPRQRDVLFLRYYLDFEYGAIAEALDVEVGTVSATLHAARNSLMDALQEVRR